jgi:hypothetical protein
MKGALKSVCKANVSPIHPKIIWLITLIKCTNTTVDVTLHNQLQNRAMIVDHTCVGILVPKDFYIIFLCNLLNISVLDEGYSIAFTLQILVSILKQELLTLL